MPNEPISENSETAANQLEAQKHRVILAQKQTHFLLALVIQSLSKGFKAFQSYSKVLEKKLSIPSRKDAEQIYVDLWNLRFKLKISGMKYKASIYTLISLMLVTSATIFIEFWCPWEIVIPSKLIFVGYGFLAVSAFLNPNLKGRNWIYGMAISLGVLRMMFMVFLKPWDSFGFIVQHVEPVVVVFVGLTSFAFALWRRFLKIQV